MRGRNFYGAVSVDKVWDDEDGGDIVTFHHGSITHGVQIQSPDLREEPLSYYGRETGIGRALTSLESKPNARAGIVGMGAATVAAYGRKGHTFRFYEINPMVPEIARQHFTYLADMEARGGNVEVVMGDARLSLEREPPQQFDVLLLDAFSGDSVPVHLLTREAFEIYLRHMKPGGIIAVHVSNTYLLLAPVVENIASVLGMKTTRFSLDSDGFLDGTDYVLLTNDEEFLKKNPPNLEDVLFEQNVDPGVWTDQRYNLYEILNTN
jgi:hypothetical protein